MRILITHQSALLLSRWRHQIAAANADLQIAQASTLTDAYNHAEHHEPDCVIIDETLANLEEFELLASLLGILKVTCLVVSKTAAEPCAHHFYSRIWVVPERMLGTEIKRRRQDTDAKDVPFQDVQRPQNTPTAYDPSRVILVGASTGGVDALLTITKHFDQQCPPTLIVQHTGGSFSKSLIRLLNAASAATVLAAEEAMSLRQGHIYLAPDDQAHLMISPKPAKIALGRDQAISGHRPSVDALFRSAIPFASRVSAALLTGMGKDGAAGLTQLREAGAHTIGQDQDTSVVYGMPRIAMEMGGVCMQLPIGQIGPALLKSCLLTRHAKK